MVPPPRNYAADAHECIMGSGRKARRIQGCGAMIGRPRHSSPRDFRLAEPMAAPRAPDIIVRRQPTRETSLVVSRKSPEREGAHAHVRLDEGARLVDERRPFPYARGRGERSSARDGRNLGPPTSAADRCRWPDACKGWPSATASGGFGLDKRLAGDMTSFDGQEQASSEPPTRLPRPDTTQIFLLTRKTSYKVDGDLVGRLDPSRVVGIDAKAAGCTRRRRDCVRPRLPREHHRLAAVDQHPVLEVMRESAREHAAFDVAALAHEVFGCVAMA